MARQSTVEIDNQFIGGLNTDFTALNFPKNTCTECFNVVFDPSGRVQRRFGFDFEENASFKNVVKDEDIVTSYLWKEVNGNGDTNLFVVQIGGTLYFYETTANSISAGLVVDFVPLSDFAVSGVSTFDVNPCHFTHGKGKLFVTNPDCEPFYVTYISNVIAATQIDVEIRDFAGVDDSLAVTDRPTAQVSTLTKEHKYNLFNQGWYFNSNAALTSWDSARTDMPSNADVWWYYKNTSDAFDATTIANYDPGETPAPKGHYVVNAWNIDREDVSGIADLPVVSTDPARPRVVAFFAGRVWYGGTNSSDTLNKLYFSQIVQNDDQVGKCYQENDPTSELKFDLLPTDGGVIEVSGAGTIYKLFPFGNALLVFASNGIWAIAGSQGLGFVANDYSVTKISALETDSNTAFVSADGVPYWWTGDAVCMIQTQDNYTFQAVKISDGKIREFLLDIPEACKQQAVGAFNPYDRTIQWLYRSTAATTVDEITEYDRVLIYNLLTQAFYVFTIPSDHAVKVHSIGMFKGFAGDAEVITVMNGDDFVVDSNGDNGVIFQVEGRTSIPVFKYLVSYFDPDLNQHRFTFAEINDPEFLDWASAEIAEPAPYQSTFTTGYKLSTATQRFFQANYIFVFLEEVGNDSSAYVQAVWDYAETGDTGKWSSKQQIYNAALTGRGVNFRRLKLRGKGRALQLRFTSQDQNPFTIIGWSIFETANQEL